MKYAISVVAFCLFTQGVAYSAPTASVTGDANDPAFHKALLEAAHAYKQWGHVDDFARFAPVLCAPAMGMGAPRPAAEPSLTILPKLSASQDKNTHGRKIYYLFSKMRASYLALGTQPVGQTIVKESWIPKKNKISGALDPDKVFALFVMTKLDPATPGTDSGWVYGTISPDGEVTSSGKVSSCIHCHQSTGNDRMFGLKKLD